MEFIPETLEALDELDAYDDDADLHTQLTRVADRARDVAPGVVGVSVASRDHDVTFTLVATNDEIATLDAVQYLTSGPCVDAIDLGRGVATSPEGLMNEATWREFAVASAASGVRSTLTFPVLRTGTVVATINLYGHAADTFVDKHHDLADVFGGWAPGAVANADLSFSTRVAAERAPLHLKETAVVDTATGILAARRGTTVAQARAHLDDAARHAMVPVARLAQVVVDLHHQW
ncbi:hypothetical protein NOCA1190105 [metagenome]|uniref:ANTAR domain-containing protein n=1 Tax=metagenome TaxID=256318 RepID=A0A2P2CCU3_9ZZZZ